MENKINELCIVLYKLVLIKQISMSRGWMFELNDKQIKKRVNLLLKGPLLSITSAYINTPEDIKNRASEKNGDHHVKIAIHFFVGLQQIIEKNEEIDIFFDHSTDNENKGIKGEIAKLCYQTGFTCLAFFNGTRIKKNEDTYILKIKSMDFELIL